MSAISKVVWIMGLICSFFLIIISGRSNVKNFEEVHQSIEGIYKDRLVVKGIIFELSGLIHQKEIAIVTGDQSFYINNNQLVNSQITENLRRFRNTVLTDYEEETLNRFSQNVKNLQESEKEAAQSNKYNFTKTKIKNLTDTITKLKQNLKVLSDIQLLEGKRKLSKGDLAVASMNSTERNENYILLIHGILMAVIIFVVPGTQFVSKEELEG